MENLPMHPGTFRLEKCLEALAMPKSAKVRTRIVPALNMYVSARGAELAPSGTHWQVVREVTARHLPFNATRVAVEHAPFVPLNEDPWRRPTYVLEVNGAFMESEEQIRKVFGPLLEKHKLQPDLVAGRHWNFGNKTHGNLFSVSRYPNSDTVALTASTPEGLLELANRYFHFAMPNQSYRPRAAKIQGIPTLHITIKNEERKDARSGQLVFRHYDNPDEKAA